MWREVGPAPDAANGFSTLYLVLVFLLFWHEHLAARSDPLEHLYPVLTRIPNVDPPLTVYSYSMRVVQLAVTKPENTLSHQPGTQKRHSMLN